MEHRQRKEELHFIMCEEIEADPGIIFPPSIKLGGFLFLFFLHVHRFPRKHDEYE